MMLGQVFNNITYNRRLSVLNVLMKEHKSKQMLKEKASIFSESHKELFGQNFREDWCTNLKTKHKYQEVLRKEIRYKQEQEAGIDRPFEGTLQHHLMKDVIEGVHHKYSSLEQCNKHEDRMVTKIKSPYLNIPQIRQVKSTSFGQKPFPCQSETGSTSNKTRPKFYSENWKKLTQDLNFLTVERGFKVPFSQINSKIKQILRTGCNSTGEIRTWGISEQFILSKQKKGRSLTCKKSQISEQLHTLPNHTLSKWKGWI